MNVEDSWHRFFGAGVRRCGDTVGIVGVARSKGKKGWVSIARSAPCEPIAQETQHQAALFN
ncbi:hypothetical protein IQ270_04955 [Microcoleus sp. LEGE 07076]|uniref:hypothetical protein n=1 Tax=Microcoleus sp. LEGE 07076 TaxID=915322 RepID=UPI00187E8370|nr:hypothetical protein [Microcoleus sp. LEGE 07076]MBE9184086.1 hypothetical protein [Microcoleus sp. LEGE 07076]